MLPILVVEDEVDQAQLIREALEDADPSHDVHVVRSGEDAIAYLSGEAPFEDRSAHPQPVLVLLDLRMPGEGGFGVLRWLRMHPAVRQEIKVVAVSATQSSKEVEVAYELGAQFFLPKADLGTLPGKIATLIPSWLN